MATREIPHDSWKEFFDGFSRRHQGWLATVEVLGAVGAQTEARELPLEGISVNDHSGKSIDISLGPPGKGVSHVVAKPSHVRIEEEGGADRALQIESADGETTLVTFRSAIPPEMVDGLLPDQGA
jgi:hypothetical protein